MAGRLPREERQEDQQDRYQEYRCQEQSSVQPAAYSRGRVSTVELTSARSDELMTSQWQRVAVAAWGWLWES